jgi:hypothetical protein
MSGLHNSIFKGCQVLTGYSKLTQLNEGSIITATLKNEELI